MNEFNRMDALNIFECIERNTDGIDCPPYTPYTVNGILWALRELDFSGFGGYYSPEAMRAVLEYFISDSPRFVFHITALQNEIAIAENANYCAEFESIF